MEYQNLHNTENYGAQIQGVMTDEDQLFSLLFAQVGDLLKIAFTDKEVGDVTPQYFTRLALSNKNCQYHRQDRGHGGGGEGISR